VLPFRLYERLNEYCDSTTEGSGNTAAPRRWRPASCQPAKKLMSALGRNRFALAARTPQFAGARSFSVWL
jgi:hypothetical protein